MKSVMRHAYALGMTFANLDGSPPDCGSSACGAKRGARVWPLQFSNMHYLHIPEQQRNKIEKHAQKHRRAGGTTNVPFVYGVRYVGLARKKEMSAQKCLIEPCRWHSPKKNCRRTKN